MNLISFKSLTSTDCREAEAWNEGLRPPAHASKDEYRKWGMSPMTDWHFISPMVGRNPHARISSANPPFAMRAIITDYDRKFTDEEVAKVTARLKKERFQPTILHRTFSGGLRGIYLFEQEVQGVDALMAEALLKIAKVKMGLHKVARGLDEDAMLRPEQLYCWWPVIEGMDLTNSISPETVLSWKSEILERKIYKDEDVSVNLEAVHLEIEKQFPGRWQGDFAEGAKGPRFWDPTADNPQGAMILKNGVYAMTGDKQGFVPWNEILGKTFVDGWQEERFGNAVKDIHFDGTHFYRRSGDNWMTWNERTFTRHLLTKGLSADCAKGDDMSELQRAMNFVEDQQYVYGRAPFLYQGQIAYQKGAAFLNTATAKALKPADGPVTAEDVPLMLEFIRTLFTREDAAHHFTQWLKRTYVGAHLGEPTLGQAAILVGPVQCGKTYLANTLIGGLLGGCANAVNYLTGTSRFNSTLLESGVALVDDGDTSESQFALGKYTQKLKAMIANPYANYEGKYMKESMVEWRGRVVIVANEDPSSMQALPDISSNSEDKVCLYRVKQAFDGVRFPKNAELDAELPRFARWLLDLPEDGTLMTDNRFGLGAYHDPTLVDDAHATAAGSELSEIVDLMFTGPTDTLVGSATEILNIMGSREDLQYILRSYTPVTFGKGLMRIAVRYPAKVLVHSIKGKSRYTISPIHKTEFERAKSPAEAASRAVTKERNRVLAGHRESAGAAGGAPNHSETPKPPSTPTETPATRNPRN